MKRGGFSGTTLVLVVVLIGAVYGIGRMVNPPPPGPPEPPKAQPVGSNQAPKTNPKEEMMKQMQMRKAEMAKIAKQHPKGAQASTQPKFDPNSIEVKSDYFLNNDPGEKGIQTMQEKVTEAKAEMEKERLERQKEKATAPPVAPTSTPAPTAH